LSSEDRKLSIDLAREAIKSSRIDAMGAALSVGGISVISSGIAIGVIDTFTEVLQYAAFVVIGTAMLIVGSYVLKKNMVDVEARLKELEKLEPKSEQQGINLTGV